ncbi:TPA: DUF551 domain-containing protein [Escherichia coli]|uniref:DUF551 domain-containing protein n=1 Tax=Escherichia coli TaxID=562 RepID=UPI00098BFE5E|nr:DUF551 domain-containing protein [Escherichia coli]MDI6937736.1 DUF551 domain-containing protein [Escherichia coli]MDI7051942.1 DUF551 domain-containing protein [Escherichia coli]MDI7095025.1 DUF551 domain-containing protein [Escherichia coli]SYX36945.1 Uncharacterised protein [Escherichia coli]
MTTFTNSKLTDEYVSNATLIRLILWADQHNSHYVVAALRELQERRKADSAEPASNHEELPLDYLQGQKDGLEWAAQLAEANHPQTGDWLYDDPLELAKAIRKGPDMPEFDGPTPVTPALLPGGFTIEEAKELHENLVRSHISKALSGEKMKKKDRDADLRWIHGVIVQAAWFIKASLEQTALSGTPPVIPDGWISCSERMPEDNKMLLAFSQGQIVAAYWNWVMSPIDYKKYRAFTYLSGNILDDVTHWMPLPEPPQEVK